MRGTLDPAHPEIDQTGIIPAHAGNTRWYWALRGLDGDHPRACGEHSARIPTVERAQGSSPRMRGTLVSTKYDGGAHGIIPAHAGNTILVR